MRELQMDDNVITIDLSKHSTGMIDSTITVPTTINGLDADTYWTNDTGSEYIFNTSEPIVWKDTLITCAKNILHLLKHLKTLKQCTLL